MLRIRLAHALSALLLTASSLAAQASSWDPDCTSGRARGAWDLPTRAEAGHVRGVLADLAGHRLAFEGRLVPVEEPGVRPGGKIIGVLMPMTSAGISGKPIAEVHGTYIVGPAGLGRFEAAIVGLDAPEGSRPELLGKFGGEFADPMLTGRDPVGRFAGRWTICR